MSLLISDRWKTGTDLTMKPHKRRWLEIHKMCQTTPYTVDIYLSEKKKRGITWTSDGWIWLYCNKLWSGQISRKSYQSLLFHNSTLRFWPEGWEETKKHAQIRLWWREGWFSLPVISTLGLNLSSSVETSWGGGGVENCRPRTER